MNSDNLNARDKVAPVLRPYGRHVLVCTGQSCGGDAGLLTYNYLKKRLSELTLTCGVQRVERSKCHCLGVCSAGPIVVIYPEAVWYTGVNESLMERIIQEHLIQGSPVKEAMLSPQLSE